MPCADVETIITFGGVASPRPKVTIIARRIGRVVIVVARRWKGARFVTPPCRMITIGKLGSCAIIVCVITERDKYAVQRVEQIGCRFVAVADT